MKRLSVNKLSAIYIIVAGLLVSACAEKVSPEEQVKKRVAERWAIRKENKIDGLYDFLSPSQRQILSRVAYERSIGGSLKYIDAKVKSVTCQGDNPKDYEVCTVKIFVDFETRGINKTKAGTLIEETWVIEEGQWWYAHK